MGRKVGKNEDFWAGEVSEQNSGTFESHYVAHLHSERGVHYLIERGRKEDWKERIRKRKQRARKRRKEVSDVTMTKTSVSLFIYYRN